MASSTLFQVHHHKACKASRRMSLLFWAGVIISFVIYVVITYFLSSLFWYNSTNYKPLITALLLASLAPLTVVYGYLEARSHFRQKSVDEKIRKLGAKQVSKISRERDRQYLNVIEEIAIAAGIHPPTAYILRKDMSINALAIADARGKTAIAVSQGALQWLNRDELQALIGHEVGHIANEDIVLYSQLSAMLHGYFLLVEWRTNKDERVNSAPEAFWRIGDTGAVGVLTNVFGAFIGWFGFVMLIYGRWMQAQFSREREWMADACAVQFTRHSTALVSTLKKVLALEDNFNKFTDPPPSQQHFLFINYHPAYFKFSTHPPLEDRIRRYGHAPSQQELDDLRYQMQQNVKQGPLDNPTEHNKQLFSAAVLFPVLTVQRKSAVSEKPLPASDLAHLRCAIMSFFIYHSDNTLFELKLNNLIEHNEAILCERYLQQLNKTQPLSHPALFIHYLNQAIKHSRSELIELHTNIKQLIKLDGAFNIYEWCLYALFAAALSPPKSTSNDEETATALQYFATWLASLHEANQKNQIGTIDAMTTYQHLCTTALPAQPAPYNPPTFSSDEMRTGLKKIALLRNSKPLYCQQIRTTLSQWQNAQRQLSMAEFYLLFTLNYALK